MDFLRPEVKDHHYLHSGAELVPDTADKFSAIWYHDLEYVAISAAQIYLMMDEKESFLEWLSEENQFLISIGADGFPNGKNEATIFSMTFLNLGGRIHSPSFLHLIFGGNIPEKHSVCMNYCKLLAEQAGELEGKKFNIPVNNRDVTVSFKVALFSCDQSFAASAAGELSCSAFYFRYN